MLKKKVSDQHAERKVLQETGRRRGDDGARRSVDESIRTALAVEDGTICSASTPAQTRDSAGTSTIAKIDTAPVDKNHAEVMKLDLA